MGEQLITAVGIIVVAIINGIMLLRSNHDRKDRERTEQRAKRRAEESLLAMEMQSAALTLSILTATKLKGGLVNGDLDQAIVEAKEANNSYQKFINRTAAAQVSKV